MKYEFRSREVHSHQLYLATDYCIPQSLNALCHAYVSEIITRRGVQSYINDSSIMFQLWNSRNGVYCKDKVLPNVCFIFLHNEKPISKERALLDWRCILLRYCSFVMNMKFDFKWIKLKFSDLS